MTSGADPGDTTAAVSCARRIGDLAHGLATRLPGSMDPEALHRLERALREAGHTLGVAATCAGLVRAGGGDAR